MDASTVCVSGDKTGKQETAIDKVGLGPRGLMVKALVFGFVFRDESLSTRDCVFKSHRGRVFFFFFFPFFPASFL